MRLTFEDRLKLCEDHVLHVNHYHTYPKIIETIIWQWISNNVSIA